MYQITVGKIPPTRVTAAVVAGLLLVPGAGVSGEIVVKTQRVDDRKAVFATVESADVLRARARIGGTVAGLRVDEGSTVAGGEEVALVADDKLALRIRAVEARMQSLMAERAKAAADLKRARDLKASGTISQAKLDAAETALKVLDRTLASTRAERQVIEQQASEGAVLAPGGGRVVQVHVTAGTVVMPGEVIATIASEDYFLRLTLPERHARFLKPGDTVRVGPRGVESAAEPDLRSGRVVQVYPRMRQGRVVADVAVAGLGDYLIGERTLVYVSTGSRDALILPESALHYRYGLAFATLGDGAEVVVQTGRALAGGVEILSGLRPGDRVRVP